MNIEKELLEDRQAKLIVNYSTEEFEGFKHRAAKKIAKNVKIPGFRPGKAPIQRDPEPLWRRSHRTGSD